MRILVIEDDDTIRDELAAGLRRNGHDVETRADGRAGLLAASDERFDAIVLDLLLPAMNGYEVLDGLRQPDADARVLATPVLVLTAKTGEYDVADVLAAGADDFVSKPFRLVEILARLDNIVARRRGESDVVTGVLSAGSLTLDRRSRIVTRGDTEIALSATEFRILERLLTAAPAVVTRDEFLDEIWDPLDPPDANIVQLYIGYIRKKIDAPFGTDTIATVRGIGYRVDVDAET